MSVTLTKYPVVVESGKVRNIFAGFDAVELEFERKDFESVAISQGVDNKILATFPSSDITGSLNVGESIYLYAEGSTYTYDNSYQITSIVFNSPNTEITVDSTFIELATGFSNYKQNWFLESKLVNPSNNDVLKYPQLLQTDGNQNGEVEVNTSMLVDFLKNELLSTSQEVSRSREECKLMYRESWREDDTQAFVLVDQDPIIIIYSAENSEIEAFVNKFEVPKIWQGYPFFLNMLHSVENNVGARVSVLFDELDINNSSITTDNQLANFEPLDFGILQTNFSDNLKEIEDNTRYIRFNAMTSTAADYQTGDYNDTDYLTTNTP